MLLTACLIVKNEDLMLQKTLPNLVKSVDEVVVVDTGSEDNTMNIAEKLGAKVHHFKWIKDFSAARNESLKYANGDWIIWVDADELIKENDMASIKAAIKDTKETAFLLKVSECREGEFNIISYNYRPKLFKNGLGIHFERPVNEQPFTADHTNIASLSKILDIPIYHWGGLLEGEKLNKKKLRNIEILEKMVAADPNDIASWFLLGLNYDQMKMYEKAAHNYDRVVQISPKGEFGLAAREGSAWACFNLQRTRESYLRAIDILKINPKSSTALNIVGVTLLAAGKTNDAIGALKDSALSPLRKEAVIASAHQKEYIANLYLSQAYLKGDLPKEAYEAALIAYKFDPTEEAKELLEKAGSQLPK